MLITKIKGTTTVSAIDVPFEKSLRCINAAEGDVMFGGIPPELKAEGYALSMLAGYNLPRIGIPEKIYGTQDLFLKLEHVVSLPESIQYYLDRYPDIISPTAQNTAILPKRYELIHETDTQVRVSGIGIDLEDHLLIKNKCCNNTGLSIGDIVNEEFKSQGYIAVICAGIHDGSKYSESTQDLYVTHYQLVLITVV
jgi:hypothetical protein